MITDTEGIVLRQVKAAGGRRMISLFSRKFGKISVGASINEGCLLYTSTNPLEQTVLYKTSGSKQAQQASLSPAVQPKSSGIAQNQEQ